MKGVRIVTGILLCLSSASCAAEVQTNDQLICFSSLLDLGLQLWDDTRQLSECYDQGCQELLKDIILGRLTRLKHEIKSVALQVDAHDEIIMVSDLELVRSIIAQIEKEFCFNEKNDASSAIVVPLHVQFARIFKNLSNSS